MQTNSLSVYQLYTVKSNHQKEKILFDKSFCYLLSS